MSKAAARIAKSKNNKTILAQMNSIVDDWSNKCSSLADLKKVKNIVAQHISKSK
jgi:hypothetical protein